MDWLKPIRKPTAAVLVVSGDRYFLILSVPRIWELRGKTITTYCGSYSAYLPQREAADERLQKNSMMPMWKKAAKLQDYIDRNLVRASHQKNGPEPPQTAGKSWKSPKHTQAEAHQLNFL